MKKFIISSFIFAFSFFALIFIGLIIPNNSLDRSIDYSIIVKHELLKKTTSPKIILTGGSNVLFGFDSEKIEDNVNSPVINHAIHAGYGLKYIIDDATQFINEGDLLVISPEYSHLLDKNYLGKEPLLFSLTAKPSNLKLISLSQLINVSPFIPKFAINRLKSFVYYKLKTVKESSEIGMYSEHAINTHGDNYQHWDKNESNFEIYEFSGVLNKDVIKYLERIKLNVNEKGAKLLIVYPSLCESSYKVNKNYIDIIDKELNNSNLNIVGRPDDFIYPDSLFFDSPYHLKYKAISSRSNKLIQIINDFNNIEK